MDLLIDLPDGEWIQIEESHRLPAQNREHSAVVQDIYTTVRNRNEECPVLDAVLAVVRQTYPSIGIQDIHELKVIVEPPDEDKSSRTPAAVVLEEVLSHIATWQAAGGETRDSACPP